jgi:hypothetical protein
MSAGSANNSSDFVGLASTAVIRECNQLMLSLGPQTVQVSRRKHVFLHTETDTNQFRMLEDPSYDQVVRWGNEGDSFVVLEASTRTNVTQRLIF